MRLMVWNCNRGFKRKRSILDRIEPDIAIIPEASEDFAGEPFSRDTSLWLGSNPRQGLGVLANNGWALHPAESATKEHLFLPCIAAFGRHRIHIVAVCAKKAPDYVSPTLRALKNLSSFIKSAPTIIAGDFNASVSFDGKRPVPFMRVIEELGAAGLDSAWHKANGERFGQESVSTYVMNRNGTQRAFHIDYAFVANSLKLNGAAVRTDLRILEDGISDHLPLVFDADITAGFL